MSFFLHEIYDGFIILQSYFEKVSSRMESLEEKFKRKFKTMEEKFDTTKSTFTNKFERLEAKISTMMRSISPTLPRLKPIRLA
jgi:predicted ribosome quality control (RQC) complex YloA/Tae2 family protein